MSLNRLSVDLCLLLVVVVSVTVLAFLTQPVLPAFYFSCTVTYILLVADAYVNKTLYLCYTDNLPAVISLKVSMSSVEGNLNVNGGDLLKCMLLFACYN